MIHFEEITNENLRAVCRLRVADEQQGFVKILDLMLKNLSEIRNL